MKKYVMITPTIANMGGAQMYVYNKITSYKDKGWRVNVFAGQGGNVLIKPLESNSIIVNEINFANYHFSLSIQVSIIDKISSIILDHDYDEIIIESTSISNSTWAESIAKNVGAKHIIFLLQEHNIVENKGLLDFFKFKYDRRELAGIKVNTLKELFKDVLILNDSDSYRLNASCNNVVLDVPSPYIARLNKSQYDYIVGILSRLDKPFVQPCITDLISYFHKYSNKQFLLLAMGDAPLMSMDIVIIKRIVAKAPNVTLMLTGYLFPVPSKLLESCDVCVASAGSVRVCAYAGVPTIAYDGNDFKPIGIFGRTTEESLFRKEGSCIPMLENLLDDILINKLYKKQSPDYSKAKPYFHLHDDFLNRSKQCYDYFDTFSLSKETRIEKYVSMVFSIIGIQTYLKLRNYRFWKWIKRIICR